MIGSTIAQYEILEEIGRGGMGIVYKAHDAKLQRDVALKFLPSDQTPESRTRFLREARAASRLSHKNIVAIHAIEHDDRDFIVMEYVNGYSLRESIEKGAMSFDEAARVASEIASALAKAHRLGVIHRDIKPENILLTEEGTPKVLDFGIAKVEGSDQLTQTEATLGTVAYMSPEQSRSEELDGRSDIFSLGVILYEMITGSKPFQGAYPAETTFRILNEDARPMIELRPDTPEALQSVVDRCLAKSRDDRYSNAEELQSDLDAFLRGERTTSATQGATGHIARERKGLSIRPLWAIPALVLVGLVAVSIFYQMRPSVGSSIAVLPFENGLDDPEAAFLCDGIAESLINRLTYIPDFKVTSRAGSFSMRDKMGSPRELGEALGVQTVLLGRLERRGENLSISAELVDTRDNSQIWGEKFSRPVSDIMEIEEEIASSIADRLRLKLSADTKKHLSEAESTSPDAYQMYLKGRYMIIGSQYEMDRAIEYFEQAIELDPSFALAWAGIAEGLALQAYLTQGDRDELLAEAKMALDKAMLFGPDSPNTLVAKGLIDYYFDWNWEAAEASFRRAIEINPGFAPAHTRLTDVLIGLDRIDEAEASAKRAVELDPLSVGPTHDLGIVRLIKKDYDGAAAEFEKAVELHPNWTWGYVKGALAHAHAGRTERAVELLDEVERRTEGWGSALIQSWVALAYGRIGNRELARRSLDRMLERRKTESVDAFAIAYGYVSVGDGESALDWLETSVEEHSPDAVWLQAVSRGLLASVSSDPRYQALVERMDFPD
jgi:serine/threonine protein kinase/tetratricopeptide (TPR) repeat protein